VSERAIVLLLPTEYYRNVGVLAVIATVLLTVFLPAGWVRAILPASPAPVSVAIPPPGPGSAHGLAVFAGLLAIGIWGPHDPLGNLLPLMVFTIWWLCMLLGAAVVGDFWHWMNPWAAPAKWAFRGRHLFRLPDWIGYAPATLGFMAFASFYLSDLAPSDPDHLAQVAATYWAVTFVLTGLFGPEWLRRGECFTVLFDLVGRMSPLRWHPPRLQFPGARLVSVRAAPLSLGIFCVSFLAIGSFDGLNETFWWMARIGINPLEFPGRSAVVWQNRLGALGFVVVLNAVFAVCVWLGIKAAGKGRAGFVEVWARTALCVLPIALAYHLAHYLTSLLVSLQYLIVALNDPLGSGAHLLGLDHVRVTTSFFNQHHTVRLIWLSQAAVIVAGHMLAVVLSHGVALHQFAAHRRAVRSQIFIAAFMVAYTFFGLWLLASPTAV
jgi:hypothetical protein